MKARALLVVLLVLLFAPRARATVYTSFDFETPGYGGNGRRLADHQLLKQGATWHLFYTELKTPVNPQTKIGHAVSTDLIHWTERPTVIAQGAEAWCVSGTWAPNVLASPSGGWILLFTAVNEFGSQSIAALTSGDLDTWQLTPENPVFVPTDPGIRWGPEIACDCRDPFVYFENGTYKMLYTAMTTEPLRPMIGRAESLDLIHWVDTGPAVIDSVTGNKGALESASLLVGPGRAELHFTRNSALMLTAPTSAGPWSFGSVVPVDPKGGAHEFATDGSVTLLSRLRFDSCRLNTVVIVVDTVTANATSYTVPGPPNLPASWARDGDAFSSQPTYGDGPLVRGDVPALPQGLRWIASGEDMRQAGENVGCVTASAGARTGYVRSPRIVLQGDVLSFRLSGRNSPDSLYAALIDDCTGEELVRQTGPGTSALTPFSWSNAGRRGWPVRLLLRDLSTADDGVLGIDAIRDTAVGTPALPAIPSLDLTAPLGNENLTPGSNYTIRWTGSSSAGIDSFCVFLSYDDFLTPPAKIARRNANQSTFNWSVPSGPRFNVRIRVAIYAKNGVHTCVQSGPFTIGAGVGVADPVLPDGLSLVARAQPGPAPVLDWSAPLERRATLDLYDLRGRRVRRLHDGPGSVRGRATWDGLDAHGNRAPPGLYFARLVSGGERVTARVVLL